MAMRVLLTSDFNRWIQGCNDANIEECYINNFIETHAERIHKSRMLADSRLGPGTAAALIEYEVKRKQPIIVTINNAKLVCVSLPKCNGELEEHYYFVNDREEWLTESPFLAQYQCWFKDVERKPGANKDYYASSSYPVYSIDEIEPPGSGVFLGGRMNWTHWNIDCLAPLLLIAPSVGSYLITSKLQTWQIDGLGFFGYNNLPRLQVSNGRGFEVVRHRKLKFVWNFDQIDRYRLLRKHIGDVYKATSVAEDLELLATDPEEKTRVRRIANTNELRNELERVGAAFIKPGSLSYADKARIYAKAKCVVTLPGSDSINALMFCRKYARIIQMVPWPNDLMKISKYSLIVSFRQMAYQSSLNVVPYYGYPTTDKSTDFDSKFYYCPSEISRLLTV